MALKEIKLDEIDVKYLTIINNAVTQIENKILALELTKFEVYDELKKIKIKYQDFSVQLKEKYNIPAVDAEIDIEKKIIVFEEEKNEKNDTKRNKHVGGTKKTSQVSEVREPPDIED